MINKMLLTLLIIFITNGYVYGSEIYGKVFVVEKPNKVQISTADTVYSIHLAGIMNPDENTEARQGARDYLSSLLLGKVVKCKQAYVDSQGKTHYFVTTVDGSSANELLLLNGLVFLVDEKDLAKNKINISDESKYDINSEEHSKLVKSYQLAQKSLNGLWSSPESVSRHYDSNYVNIRDEYLKRLKEVNIDFDPDTHWPVRDIVKNGTKLIGTDVDVSSFITPDDVGSAIYRSGQRVSLLTLSDTYKVPVKEVSEEMVWSSWFKGRLDFANDSVLCNEYSDIIPEGLEGYNFYNCMTKLGWRLREATVEHSKGLAELKE